MGAKTKDEKGAGKNLNMVWHGVPCVADELGEGLRHSIWLCWRCARLVTEGDIWLLAPTLSSEEAAAVADCIASETLRWRLIEKEGELEGLLWEVVADSQIPALVGDKLIPAGTIETMYQDGRPSFQCQWCYQDVGEGYGHTPECLIVRIHEALATIDEEKDNEPCA